MELYRLYILIVLIVTYATARTVKFGLVAFGTKAEVNINGEKHAMTHPNTKDPYYTLDLKVDDSDITYKYVVDGTEEEFERTLPQKETTTHNEFFGRKDTIKELPEFNHPDKGSWKRSIGKTQLFDDSYIPTVHIYGTNANNTFTNASASVVKRVAFILKDDVIIVKNPALYTKNRNWDKFQFRLVMNYNTGDTTGVYGRYVLKFRDNNEDPTFFRQKLYSDIMDTIGAPTIQSVFARVYVNNIPVGLYVIQEEAASESFVRAAFHGDNKGNFLLTDYSELGHPLDCATGSDFEYVPGSRYSSFKPYNSTRYDNSRIINLAKAFDALDATNDDEIEKFNKEWFDIDTFFKAIAMQYLTGHWDSYWFYSTNFAVYDDPTESTESTNKFYFICQDWDGTFGLNISPVYTRYADEEFTSISYKRYVNIEWGVDTNDAPHRYAIDKLLSNPKLQARFEEILTDIVKYIMNPTDFNKRLDAFVERFRDEVEFTFNVTPWRKGTEDIKWTMDDFERNINYRGRHGASYGLKEFVYKRASFINKEFNLGLELGENVYENIKECGPGFGKCSEGKCCSKYGYCGTTDVHCEVTKGCQVGFGICNGQIVSSTIISTESTSEVVPTLTEDTTSTSLPGSEEVTSTTQSGSEEVTSTTQPEVTSTTQSGSEEVTSTTQPEVTSTTQSGSEEVTSTTQSGSEEVTSTTQSGSEEVTSTTQPEDTSTTQPEVTSTTQSASEEVTSTTQPGSEDTPSTTISKIEDTPSSTVSGNEETSTVTPTISEEIPAITLHDNTVSTEPEQTTSVAAITNTSITTTVSTTTTDQSKITTIPAIEEPATTTTLPTLPISTNGLCGPEHGICPNNKCCSKWGYCGNTSDYCDTGCQKDYGRCNEGTTTSTKPTATTTNLPFSDGACGPGIAVCTPGKCCSKYGYCGTTDAYCGNGCQSEFGMCNTPAESTTPVKTKTTTTKTTTTKAKTTTTKSTTTKAKTTTTKSTTTKSKTTTKKTTTTKSKTTTKKTTTTKTKTTTTKKTKTTKTTSTRATATVSGRCGADFGGACSKPNYCCSKYNYCGTSDAHCGQGCQPKYGICY